MKEPAEKSEKHPKSSLKPSFTLLIIMVVVVFLGYKVARDPVAAWGAFCNIAIVVLGFGAVIFVHELGHFIAAKSVGILVEGFSLGFGPIVISFKKVQGGLQVRILPSLIPGRHGRDALRVVIPLPCRQDGDTEYRINLIPLGGFVKMLGQEDVAADKPSDDPRAFGNKAVWQRSMVIAAGVTMNVICGAIVFMIVFAQGYAMPPAVVGDVSPLRPAAMAGIRPGDVITAVNGKKPFGFMDVFIAAAFADDDEKVSLNVTHTDGTTETLHVAPKQNELLGIKAFGFSSPSTLTISQDIQGPDFLEEMEKLNIKPGDKIVAINGEPISHYYRLSEVLYPPPGQGRSEILTLTFERIDDAGAVRQQTLEVPMVLIPVGPEEKRGQVMGMAPRLKVVHVDPNFPSAYGNLKDNDIILRIGTLSNPTLDELGEYCVTYENQSVELLVQRIVDDQSLEKLLNIIPQKDPRLSFWAKLFGKVKPRLGIKTTLDLETMIVASVRENMVKEFPELALLPRGARIAAIDDHLSKNWEDLIERLVQNQGRTAGLSYKAGEDQPTQTLNITVPDNLDWLGFVYRPDLPIDLPLEPQTELFKGNSWLENLSMGMDRTYSFLAQSYLFIRGMFKGTVKPSAASGPVGILKLSYTIAEEKNLIDYLHFMAIISICIAFFNFLPIPVLDGGHFLMLIIEKIKGSPVSIKAQEIVTYAGLLLIVGFVLFVTYNDILKIITGQL